MQPSRFIVWIAVAALLFGALPVTQSKAQQDTISANYHMKGCRDLIAANRDDTFSQGVCVGVIDGISWAVEGICAPKGVIRMQRVKVVVAYIDKSPARLHESFYLLALEAMMSAWPCPKP